MNKFLVSVFLGAAAVIGLVTFNQVMGAEATVFHHNVAANNADSCMTPQEMAGVRQGKYEKIAAYFDADAVKFKEGFVKVEHNDPTKMGFWDGIDAYSWVDVDGTVKFQVSLYKKNADGVECVVTGGVATPDEWASWVNAAGLQPAVTTPAPAPANTNPPTATKPKG